MALLGAPVPSRKGQKQQAKLQRSGDQQRYNGSSCAGATGFNDPNPWFGACDTHSCNPLAVQLRLFAGKGS